MKPFTQFAKAIALLSLLMIALIGLVQPVLAAKEDKPPKLFDDSSEWNVTLAGPWRKVQKQSKKDLRYPAQLTYPGADGQSVTVDIEVEARGITRRRICDFPPLKIFFNKDEMKGTELRGNKSLKLVTYCNISSKYEQYYIKEFLAYRIYNLITDFSFRVKPLLLDYVDNERNSKPITRFGFLIEDLDEVADRNDLKKLNIGKARPSELDSLETSYFSLFQYMVGNLDFAATGGPDVNRCCHNSRLIGVSENENPKYVIPYDFDSTGLVSAHYAAPPEKLKVRTIRQRLYRGFCAHNSSLAQAVARYQDKKTEILALFTDNTHITGSIRNRAIKYIEDFYIVLDDPKRFKREITDKCRG